MRMLKKTVSFFILTGCAILLLVCFIIPTDCLAFKADEARFLFDQSYFPVVRDLLRNARESIKVIMFEASYYKQHPLSQSNQLINELISARRRGLSVSVILEVKDKKERTSLRNLETARILKKGGAEVTLDAPDVTTHAKLILVDNKIVVLGSSNWTYNALNNNHEVSILIKSQNAVKELEEYFYMVQKSGRKF